MSEEMHELVSRYVLGSSFRYEGPEAQARPPGHTAVASGAALVALESGAAREQTKEERDDYHYHYFYGVSRLTWLARSVVYGRRRPPLPLGEMSKEEHDDVAAAIGRLGDVVAD